MNTYRLSRVPRICMPLLFATLLASCDRTARTNLPDPAFAPYITAFTSGRISAVSPIRVRLADDLRMRDTSRSVPAGLFKFDPPVDGTTTWEDERTLVFRPNERLGSNARYSVDFALGSVAQVPKGMERFQFQVEVIQQAIDVRISELRSLSTTDLTWQQLILAVYTSDDATGQDLEACFTASQEGRALVVSWEHEPNGRFHRLLCDSVRRGDSPSRLLVKWKGAGIGAEDAGELPFDVPSINELRLVSSSTNSNGEQSATFLFSDPLDERQDLRGLAGIAGADVARSTVQGNRLLVYPKDRIRGDAQAFIAAGLRNVNGKPLGTDLTVDLVFEEVKPAVRLVGKGTILPSTDGLLMPFEAVNLSAVDVRVVRIYTSNVAQFLQVNRLDGDRELTRVGRIVARKTVPLDQGGPPVPGRWERYHLNLDELIKAEPGAIYRVSIGFRRQHSMYPCDDSSASQSVASHEDWDERDDEQWDEVQQWSYYYDGDEEYYDYEDGFDWRQRDEPCSPSYYGSQRTVARNILASDIGLIAKRGNNGALWMICSDLRSTKPMPGVRLEVVDLQRQVIAEVVTDGEGLATLPASDRRPFLVTASKGSQRGYLRLDEGSALGLSEFDVQGSAVDRGLKGFLYGERGVWRPGDTLFLTFMLQDGQRTLPKDHPVVLELTDPRGRMDQRHVRNSGVDGVYAFRCTTSPDAPTGQWNAAVRVGGTTFHKSLRIETVKPNRLKILLDPGGERLLKEGDASPMSLTSSWLHGAPARGLRARVTATFTRMEPDLPKARGFVFNDLATSISSDERVVFEGQLNDAGKAAIPVAFARGVNERAPAAIRVNLVTRVFEAGGDASIDRTEIPYYPYSAYAGLKVPEAHNHWDSYMTDTTYRFEVASVDARGELLTGRALKAQVIKVSSNWWWDGDDNGGGNYMTAPSSQLLQETDLTTDAKGRAVLPFRINRPLWGRFVVRVSDPASGHVSAVQLYVDWPGYEGRARRGDAPEAAVLRFNSDKERYAVGEFCELTIPSSGTGRALVSLETGTQVLEARWVELKERETRFRFTVTANMDPTVYAHVTLIQPHRNTENDLPMRLYGVIPIHVEDPTSHLFPMVDLPNEIRTDERFTVRVSEKEGRGMTYTLAIVDEGLLDLTRFKTPDPWAHFHAREALGVRTWDVYDQVIGAFGRSIQRVLAMGGSDEGKPNEAARANRFKPVVRYIGPFKLAPNARGDHSFTLSNYVGSVRVMVVATDEGTAYGHQEKAVPVRKPVMVLATLPRVLGPGELADLPVNVFAMDPSVKSVKVRVEMNDLLIAEGPIERTVNFTTPGDQVTTFRVRVADRVGVARVKVIAEGGRSKATEAIELQVREPNAPQTIAEEHLVEAGAQWKGTPIPIGLNGTNSAYLEVSTIPPVDMGRRLQFLIGYPHGCLEQTTSKAFPQVFLHEVMELDARLAQETRANVEAGIRRLKQFQRSDGSFTYWPGSAGRVDDWCNVYAGHFLVEADRAGMAVPAAMKRDWVHYTRREAASWNHAERTEWTQGRLQLLQAYRLHVLALAGSPEVGAMNRLRTTPRLEFMARWVLAGAYAIMGQAKAAEELVNGLANSVAPYTEMAYTYGSDLRDEALIAEALIHMGRRTEAAPIVQRMARRLSSEEWHSTQATASALLAVSRFARIGGNSSTIRMAVELEGVTTDRQSNKALVRIALPIPDGKRAVGVQNKGAGPLFVRLVRNGVPAAGNEQATAKGLVLSVDYHLMDGTSIDPTTVEQGTDLKAVVTVAHPGGQGIYRQLALTQILPSGWEVRNSRMEGTENAERDSQADYKDIRDDRVMTYFDLAPGHTATFTILLNASYLGRYYLPGVGCEAMYDHTVNARTQGRWVHVIPAGGLVKAGR
ncbi:MAG: hypothetical protein JNM31_00300 [Flavobacteriales bacterium]|nr:hypothetical protein [Flavobacteriales bacterium]